MRQTQKAPDQQPGAYIISGLNAPRVPRMCSINAAAESSGLPDKFIRQLIREKKIPYVMSGTKYLVNLDRLIDYLNTGDAAYESAGSN